MNKSIKLRLIVMNIIQWAVWGAYLTSMANYLISVKLGAQIPIFFALQGIVSIFMPTIMGIVAEPEAGKIYHGTITKIMDFGAFVRFLGSTEVDVNNYWTEGKNSQQLRCNETVLYAEIDCCQELAAIAKTKEQLQEQ